MIGLNIIISWQIFPHRRAPRGAWSVD